MWNTVINVNSVLCALAIVYLIYATGASLYYWTPRPFEFGVLIVFLLLCTEVLIAVLEENEGH
jgi:hypothetical protein